MLQKPDNLAFPGYINRKKVREALNGCDLFLMPTYEETEGIPIIEACSCKTKILTRDIDVWNEDFKDKENIYLASTIDEFENKIDLILNDKLKDLTEEAYKVAEKKNIKNVSKLLKKAYEEVMYEK
jgi:1,2-diacylglycerol-3-alpha-glucose alpha-1,2-glucosyltransferase